MRTLFLGSMMTLLVLSCKKDLQDDQEKINNDLRITMSQSTDKELLLHVKTEQQFSCSNYMVDFGQQSNGKEITIQFNHVQLHNVCLTAFGSATNDIVLGELQPGKYSLVLKCNGKEHAVPLTVSTDKYSVKDASGKFFSFTNTEFLR